jgi:hypothetical protein
VGDERWMRIAGALAPRSQCGQFVGLCSACAETLSVAGAGITLMAGAGAQVSMCASNATVSQLAELELTLGCGPAADAYQRGVPVFETDLVEHPPAHWAPFAGPAVELGARAVFAFPLRVGAARLGALVLHQAQPGSLGDDTYADGLVAADVITNAILAAQAGTADDALTAELTSYHAEIHQAAGMVSVQLDVGVGEALARLRARAFALSRPIADLAADVVARRLRLDD